MATTHTGGIDNFQHSGANAGESNLDAEKWVADDSSTAPVGGSVEENAEASVEEKPVVTPAEAGALQLTGAQRTAIIRLTSGSTRSAAAIAAGVTRGTIYNWLNHDPAFQAAFNAWQKDLVTTVQGQMLAAAQEAMGVVLNGIRKGDTRLAWKLLESQGLTKPPTPGPTDVRELQFRAELDRKKKDVAERKEVSEMMQDDMMTIDIGR